MDRILIVLHGTIEWKQFQAYGLWNLGTLGAIGVLVTSLMEVYGLYQQGRTVWRKRSGESVSVTLFNYTTWYFLFCGIYGLCLNSAAAAFSGIITFVAQIPIFVGLIHFKKFAWWETALAILFPLMPVSMLLVPADWRGTLFMTLGLGAIGAMGTESLELWKTKKTGALDIRLFRIYFITTLVWMVFVCSVGDLPLIVNQTLMTIMIVAIIALWCVYRAKEPDPPRLLARIWRQPL